MTQASFRSRSSDSQDSYHWRYLGVSNVLQAIYDFSGKYYLSLKSQSWDASVPSLGVLLSLGQWIFWCVKWAGLLGSVAESVAVLGARGRPKAEARALQKIAVATRKRTIEYAFAHLPKKVRIALGRKAAVRASSDAAADRRSALTVWNDRFGSIGMVLVYARAFSEQRRQSKIEVPSETHLTTTSSRSCSRLSPQYHRRIDHGGGLGRQAAG